MVWMRLLDLFVQSVTTQDRIELFDLHSVGSVLPVLRGDVARRAWHARVFVLCALQNHLYAVAFLRHGFKNWDGKDSEFPRSVQCPFSHPRVKKHLAATMQAHWGRLDS